MEEAEGIGGVRGVGGIHRTLNKRWGKAHNIRQKAKPDIRLI